MFILNVSKASHGVMVICVLYNIESEIEQGSLCLLDGAARWGQTGTALSLSVVMYLVPV